ncbi:MAG: hypothetical protein GF308_04930 [Candidatus Heimdallarchaeota archaeon]|nr:hypothetical protein [Candidatus Heimdallarchaeota archaeon]
MSFSILGFGQVIWDLTVSVDYRFLKLLSIEKGDHSLVNYRSIEQLLSELTLTGTKVLKNPGGSCANVMANLAKLGSKVAFVGKHGDDPNGHLFMKLLKEDGVTPYSIIDQERATGQLLSLITPDKDRTFVVYRGASGFFHPKQIDEQLIKEAEIVHIGGYLVNSEKALWKIFKNAKKTTFDLSAQSIIKQTRPHLQKMMKKYPPEVLFANIFEGSAFTQSENEEEIINHMLDFATIAVLTLGERGALVAKTKENHHYEPGIVTDVADTTGAGDAFCAGFLHSFLKNHDIEKSAKLGNKIASKTIRRIGARSLQLN